MALACIYPFVAKAGSADLRPSAGWRRPFESLRLLLSKVTTRSGNMQGRSVASVNVRFHHDFHVLIERHQEA